MENNFKIVTPFFNAEKYIRKSLSNSLSQSYDKFKIILINDGSSDNSENSYVDLLDKYSDKIIYIKNENRMGAMFNHQNAILNYCDNDDIVVQVDGDDWLIDDGVLSYINDFYNEKKCMVMYGQSQYLSGRIGNACPYIDKKEFEDKRLNFKFHVSHVRTFYAKLFFEIKNQDNNLSCFKNSRGEWYKMTCDVAIMYPVMEICGYEKVKYNDKILYVYNDSNPIQDYKIDLKLQEDIHREILSKPAFNRKTYE